MTLGDGDAPNISGLLEGGSVREQRRVGSAERTTVVRPLEVGEELGHGSTLYTERLRSASPTVRAWDLEKQAPLGSADADDTRPLVDTGSAAETLRMSAPTLFRFAEARIVTPARIDPDGTRWWNLREMRRQIANYLDDHSEVQD